MTTITEIGGDVDTSVSGGENNGTINQTVNHFYAAAVRMSRALDAAAVARLRRIHVPTPESRQAGQHLAHHGTVALIGDPGTGRQITGLVLLAEQGYRPRVLTLDSETLRQHVQMKRGQGYVFDLDEVQGQPPGELVHRISELVGQARDEGAKTVFSARRPLWGVLDVPAVPTVLLAVPEPALVLGAHLTEFLGEPVAGRWSGLPGIREALTSATTRDAVRLAEIVTRVAGTVAQERELEEVLDAFHNWAEPIADWFANTANPEEGRRRARVLAVSALEGAPHSVAWAAAEKLVELAGLSPEEGDGLLGPDLRTLVHKDRIRMSGETVRFDRAGYGEAVLDHVWRERPQQRPLLRKWMIQMPIRSSEALGVWESLTALASRHDEVDLVVEAVRAWSGPSALREAAVAALTVAAGSPTIGRRIRRKLYDWAITPTTDESLCLTVAGVCAGPMADAYPDIALTRLRHLAGRAEDRVQIACAKAVTQLWQREHLRGDLLGELRDWNEYGGNRASTAARVFHRLAGTVTEEGELALLVDLTGQRSSLLSRLWEGQLRAVLPESARILTIWLDQALHTGRAEPVAVLSGAVTSNLLLGNLVRLATPWLRSEPGQAERERLFAALLRATDVTNPFHVPEGSDHGAMA